VSRPRERLTAEPYFFAAARLAAHIFFVAAMITALPAALSFRFFFVAGFGAGVADALGSESRLTPAHLLRWASAMALRAAALTFRRAGFAGAGGASAGCPEKECAEFGDLEVNFSFLFLKAFDSGCDKFGRDFWCWHLFLQFATVLFQRWAYG
jgi:hypothetical protein